MDIIPSILGATLEEAHSQTAQLDAISHLLHLDVMDGQFVPEMTPINISEVADAHHEYDVHLMVADPASFLHSIHTVKTRYIFIHAELSDYTLAHFFETAHGFEGKLGLALNLETHPDEINAHAHFINAILLMGVDPGASGRPFDQRVVEKITHIKRLYPHLYVAVDGGVNESTLPQLKSADGVVVHSALFKSTSIDAEYQKLRTLLT